MMIDRSVHASTPNNLDIEVRRQFAAPRALVFEAHTRPDLIRRWLLGPPGWTMPECEFDLTVGGRYRYVWRHEDGAEMTLSGTHLEVEPPARIVSTQRFGAGEAGGDSIVTLALDEADGITTMTVTVRYASQAARDAALQTGMTDGMGMGYERLDALLVEIG